ncbi:antitoxin MazE family protein [Dietzia sp. NCCP-2495]|uniref:antitoxin MazE family protein n=1 Tax=Dietzia sp. NCCP-2495 TaxID=2934675 RepID=UPI0022315971|nr:antitoxin MazE family protein [Dietzia sp. NCCP-2495]
MSSSDRVCRHWERLRAHGLRPVQIWVPDVTWPGFAVEDHRQSAAIATSAHEAEDQALVDDMAADWGDD